MPPSVPTRTAPLGLGHGYGCGGADSATSMCGDAAASHPSVAMASRTFPASHRANIHSIVAGRGRDTSVTTWTAPFLKVPWKRDKVCDVPNQLICGKLFSLQVCRLISWGFSSCNAKNTGGEHCTGVSDRSSDDSFLGTVIFVHFLKIHISRFFLLIFNFIPNFVFVLFYSFALRILFATPK